MLREAKGDLAGRRLAAIGQADGKRTQVAPHPGCTRRGDVGGFEGVEVRPPVEPAHRPIADAREDVASAVRDAPRHGPRGLAQRGPEARPAVDVDLEGEVTGADTGDPKVEA